MKLLLKPSVHLMTDLFAIAKSVLNERNLVSCQNVQIASDSGRLGSDGVGFLTQVATLPESCGKGVCVANQDPVRLAGSTFFPGVLLGSDMGEFVSGPDDFTATKFRFAVFPAILRNPHGLESLGQILCQSGRPSGFRP